jgi:hypothetical protein
MCKYSIFPKKNIFIFANIKISNNGRHKSFVRQALANSRPATYDLTSKEGRIESVF